MVKTIFILTIFLETCLRTLCYSQSAISQTVEIDDWKIFHLKIHSITVTTIFHPDSVKPDTFPLQKEFYDTTAKLIEKRYDYRRFSLISNEFKYTSAFYKYDKSGKLIDTKIQNPDAVGQVLSGVYPKAKTECKYFDTDENLIRTELIREKNIIETSEYSYNEFKEEYYGWTIKLPVQIDNYYNGHLERKTIIDYSFY